MAQSRISRGDEDMTKTAKARRILINDDGWIMSKAEPPLTVNALKKRMVDSYQDSPVVDVEVSVHYN